MGYPSSSSRPNLGGRLLKSATSVGLAAMAPPYDVLRMPNPQLRLRWNCRWGRPCNDRTDNGE